jgi:hypothetical protein
MKDLACPWTVTMYGDCFRASLRGFGEPARALIGPSKPVQGLSQGLTEGLRRGGRELTADLRTLDRHPECVVASPRCPVCHGDIAE